IKQLVTIILNLILLFTIIEQPILLGFEFLQKQYTGTYLAEILMNKILRKYNIQDRIVTMISDNTSNNNILIKAIKKNYNIDLIQSLCLAHIIQLNLNTIFAQIKTEPKNNQIKDSILSTDDYTGLEIKISTILKKINSYFLAKKYLAFNDFALLAIYSLAVFVNNSSLYKESFLKLQRTNSSLSDSYL
ncbi:hypothetical protein N7450_004075, partial [Penicillium hetheringtonii]